jgi:retinol-binding protein 3
MKKIVFLLILIVNLLVAAPAGFSQSQSLTAEIRKQTIEDLAALLPERYAYKEIGQKLQQLLREKLQAGKYDLYASPLEFSIAVTNDLRSFNSDRHLALNFSPQTQPAASTTTPTRPPTAEEQAKQVSVFNRQMNFGFKNVRFLNGNVGYLKFDYFDSYLEYSSPVVDAAMAFFKNSDALIIDLRENGGGSGQMVNYIAGFFFRKRQLTGTSYNRLTDTTTEEFITPQPDEKQLPEMDLYILTSKSTVSAAEALAYNLKYLKNAKVIGETSAGAANPGRVTRLNNLFTAFIPNRHGMNVVTKTNWEGTGVPVDISCPAEDALRVARIEALKKLRQRATDSLQQKKFDNYITYLEKTEPEIELPEKTLRQYAGEYQGGRTITLKNGKLFYARVSDVGGELHFISTDVFMLSEGDVRMTFKRNKQNRVIEMESQWSLSNTPVVAAKIK